MSIYALYELRIPRVWVTGATARTPRKSTPRGGGATARMGWEGRREDGGLIRPKGAGWVGRDPGGAPRTFYSPGYRSYRASARFLLLLFLFPFSVSSRVVRTDYMVMGVVLRHTAVQAPGGGGGYL